MGGVVGSAMVTEITSRIISKVIEKCHKQAAVDEKLRKLEMLCIKIHSTVEASEKHLIPNNYLLKWQEKLKEAATYGDEVLFTFHWRALNEASRSTDNQIETSCPLVCTKIAMSSMAHYCHNAAKMLFSLDKDMEELSTVDRLSADIEEFLRLVELEVLTEEDNSPTKWKKPVCCDSSALHLQQEEKRPFDSVLDPTKMIESVKRAMHI